MNNEGNDAADTGSEGESAATDAPAAMNSVLNSRTAKIVAIIGTAATVTTGLATLTNIGRDSYVAVRQFAFAPQLQSKHLCGQSVIALHSQNSGWTSISVGRPEIIWTEGGKARPPAFFAVRAAPPAKKMIEFPVRLEPGEKLDARLENDGDGFYFPVDPLSSGADGRKCQLEIRLPLANRPGPGKARSSNFPCECV